MTRSIIFLFALIFLSASCKNDITEVSQIFSEAEADVERIEDIDITYSDTAKVKLRVRAPIHLRYLEKANQIDEFVDGVRLDFLDEGEVTAWLTADWAKRDSRKKETIMKGKVTLVNQAGHKLETTKMVWKESMKLLTSDEFVRLTRGKEQMLGYGFKTDENFDKFEITSVEAIVEVEN